VYYDPFQALQLAENLTRAGLWCVEVPQTHASRGPKDTALFELAANGQLVLYDDPELKAMASAASARELGNGLLWIEKGGRGKIDLLIALSNCADEVRKMYTGAWVTLLDQVSDDEEW
jgi:phage terminase large subunit-like protein